MLRSGNRLPLILTCRGDAGPISFPFSQRNKPPIVTPITLSPLDLLVSLGPLVPLTCRFYSEPDGRSAHARIRGKLCRGHFGSQADRFVLLSGPGRFSIHTARIFQAFSWLFWAYCEEGFTAETPRGRAATKLNHRRGIEFAEFSFSQSPLRVLRGWNLIVRPPPRYCSPQAGRCTAQPH